MIKRHYLIILWVLVFCINCAVHAADMTVTLKDNTSNSGFSIVNASGTITARFRGDGNVGIGTTTPGHRLDIQGGDLNITADRYLRGGGEALFSYVDANADGFRDAYYGSADGSAQGGHGIDLILSSGGGAAAAARLFIKALTGNVGIGTTTPSTTLHVNGTITATYFSGNGSGLTGITSSASTNSVNSASIVDGSITGSDLASNISISTTGTMSVASGGFVVDSSGSMTAATVNSSGTITANGNLIVDSSTLFVDSVNNRVGVGTTTPQSALTVDGTVTISGNKLVTWANNTTNTFLGVGAGGITTTGSGYNTANGYQALYSNTTGWGNIANGYQALYSNTTGNRNTANGYRALYSNTTGTYNTANGASALYSNTSGYGNTANGWSALYSNTTGTYNTANGHDALKSNTTGNESTAIGYSALYSNTTGTLNTAIGYVALYNNTTGSYNTAIGAEALSSNTGSGYNTAIGWRVNRYNTTGSYNTAIGCTAFELNTTGRYNTANGYTALYNNTTGEANTAIGYRALHSNTTGTSSTALGYQSGYSALGSGNVFLGYNAGYNETGSNKLYIANSSSSTLIYGDFSTTKVGIGTTTPSTTLHVNGTITATGFVGDGSQLTGISGSSGTPSANSVSSSSIIDGSITGSDLASNISITTTGTLTASGNLNIDAGTLFVDAANNRVGIGITTPTSGKLVVQHATNAQTVVGVDLAGLTEGGITGFSRPDDGNVSAYIGIGEAPNDDMAIQNASGSSQIRIGSNSGGGTAVGIAMLGNASSTTNIFGNTRPTPDVALLGNGTLVVQGNTSGNEQMQVVNGNRKVMFNTNLNALSEGGIVAFSRPDDSNVTAYIGIGEGTNDDMGILTTSGGSQIRIGGWASGTSVGLAFFGNASSVANIFGNTKPGAPVEILGNGNLIIGGSVSASLGVGTSVPGGKFEVQHSTNNKVLIDRITTGGPTDTDAYGPSISISRNSDGAVTHNIYSYDTVGDVKNNLAISSRSDIVILNNLVEHLRILETGKVGIGTTTPSTALVVIGTITATQGFVGDGSQLTGISSSSVGANSVSSSSIIDGSITGSDMTSTLNMTTQALNIGSLTVSAGNFRVDSAGSMTASTITSGTVTVTSGNVGIGTTNPVTSLSIGGSSKSPAMTTNFQHYSPNANVDQGLIGWNYFWNGSVMARQNTSFTGIRFAANPANSNVNSSFIVSMANTGGTDHTVLTGALDSSGAYGILNANSRFYVGIGDSNSGNPLSTVGIKGNTAIGSTYADLSAPSNGVIVEGKVGIGTTTPSTALVVIGTVTATQGFVGNGSQLTGISASSVGANSVSSSSILDGTIAGSDLASNISINTTGTMSVASGNFVVDSSGSMTASAITTTGTLTVSGNKIVTNSQHTTNTLLGLGAGNSITWDTETGGTLNTANGYRALYSNTYGAYNTANGSYVLYSNTTGNYNTAIGYNAGYNALGSGNVFLGYQAGYNETGSDKLHIANSSSSTLIYGDFSNSRVGIGTTTPSTTLVVNGTVTATGGYYGYNGMILNSEGGSSPSKGIRLTNGTNNSYVNTNAVGTLEYNTEVDHVFYTGASTERFRIVSTTGNVGIGTSTPQTKLVVNGTVTASAGDIQVIGGSFVDDGTTLSVPDYVFDADYPLKPLAQVKAYTQEHRHLEGIPDMNDKKGWASLSIQDRDMKLLEKIEELTLYVIQMKEENDELKTRISALETSRMSVCRANLQVCDW